MMASDTLPRRSLTLLLVAGIVAAVFAAVLFVLLSALDFIGFDGNSPITADCSSASAYYQAKYPQIALMMKTAYIFSLLCLLCSSAGAIIIVKCVLAARDLIDSELFVSKCTKVSLYVLASVAVMTAVPPFYYVSLLAEVGACTAAYDSSRLKAVVTFAVILLAVLLVLFVLLFVSFCATSEEKYREVKSNPTEPNDKVERAQEVKYFNRKPMEKEEPYKRQPEVY
jgi:hypothetical protein